MVPVRYKRLVWVPNNDDPPPPKELDLLSPPEKFLRHFWLPHLGKYSITAASSGNTKYSIRKAIFKHQRVVMCFLYKSRSVSWLPLIINILIKLIFIIINFQYSSRWPSFSNSLKTSAYILLIMRLPYQNQHKSWPHYEIALTSLKSASGR